MDSLSLNLVAPLHRSVEQGPEVFNPSLPTLEVMGSLVSPGSWVLSPESQRIFQTLAIEVKAGRKLREAVSALPSVDQEFLRNRIGHPSLNELLSISREEDPELFCEALLHFGLRFKAKQDLDRAAVVLGLLSQTNSPLALRHSPLEVRKRAEIEFNAILGRGDLGTRLEVLGGGLAKESTNWRAIAPMVGASIIGNIVGTGTLSKLLTSASGKWFTRGWGAKFASGLAGYSVEFPLYAGLSWAALPHGSSSFWQHLGGSATTIGVLKSFGSMGRHLFGRWHGILSPAPMFGGLMVARKIEERIGIRDPMDDATLAADSLYTMVTLGVGSRLGYSALGRDFAAFHQGLHRHAERMGRMKRYEKPDSWGWGNQLAAAYAGAPFDRLRASSSPLPLSPEGRGQAAMLTTYRGELDARSFQRFKNYVTTSTSALRRLMHELGDVLLQERFQEFLREKMERIEEPGETELENIKKEFSGFLYGLFDKAGGPRLYEWMKVAKTEQAGEVVRFLLNVAETFIHFEISHEDLYSRMIQTLVHETINFRTDFDLPLPSPVQLYRPGYTALPFLSAMTRYLESPKIPIPRILKGVERDYPWVIQKSEKPEAILETFSLAELDAIARAHLERATPEEKLGNTGRALRRRQVLAAQAYLAARSLGITPQFHPVLLKDLKRELKGGILYAWPDLERIPSGGIIGKVKRPGKRRIILSDVRQRNGRGDILKFPGEVVILHAYWEGKPFHRGEVVRWMAPVAGGSDDAPIPIPVFPIPTEKKQVLVGTVPWAHYRIEDPDLLGVHCTIVPVGDHWEVHNHSPQGIYVNVDHVTRFQTIKPGDIISLRAADGRWIQRFHFGEEEIVAADSGGIETPLAMPPQTEELYPLDIQLKVGWHYLLGGSHQHWSFHEDGKQGKGTIHIPDSRVCPRHAELTLNEDGTLTVIKRGAYKTAVWTEDGYFVFKDSFILRPGEYLDLGIDDPTQPRSPGLLLLLGEDGKLYHSDLRLSHAPTRREIPIQLDPGQARIAGLGPTVPSIDVIEGKEAFVISVDTKKGRIEENMAFATLEEVRPDPGIQGYRATFKIVWPLWNQELNQFDPMPEWRTFLLSDSQAKILGIDIPQAVGGKFLIRRYKAEAPKP